METENLAAKHGRAEAENLAAKFFQLSDVPSVKGKIMEKQLFEELVISLRQAVDAARASNRKQRTRRRLAEHIREERQAAQMRGPRAFIKKRPLPKHLRARGLSKVVVTRRKVTQK
jgi:hypothetical protein